MLELLSAEVPTTRDHLEHELLRVRGEIEIRELYFSRLAAAQNAMEIDEDIEAEQTPIDWLRINCRLTQQAAADRVHIGQKLPVMPQSENCLYTGEVGIQHLAVMARTAIAVGPGFDETKLLPLAKKHSPGRFYHESLHYRHSMRPQEVAAEQADLVENRHLSMSTAEDGCLVVQGVRDPVVIDVGRAQRVIKGPKRRALIARDKHCQWPGCERPASYCDGHHIVHWMNGGGLELENMALLCHRHHWMVHEGGWQIVKTESDGLLPVAPMHIFGMPRGPD